MGQDLAGPEMDHMSRLLMHLISIKFANSKWHTRLPKGGLDPHDTAQSLLIHLQRKMRRMDKIRHPCWRVMLSILYRECHFAVMTMLESHSAKSRAVTASAVSTHDSPGESGPMYSEAPSQAPLYDDWYFARFMRSAEELVIDRIKGDPAVLQATYRMQYLWVMKRNQTMAWRDVPKRLREHLSTAQHATIVRGVVRLVEEFASRCVYREDC